MLMKLN